MNKAEHKNEAVHEFVSRNYAPLGANPAARKELPPGRLLFNYQELPTQDYELRVSPLVPRNSDTHHASGSPSAVPIREPDEHSISGARSLTDPGNS